MAKRKGVNKSQAIRDYLASHPAGTPNEIVAALAEQGVKVSPGLASNVKYTSGPKGRKKGGKKRLVKRRLPGGRSSASFTTADLVAAKDLVNQVGGIEAARRALDTLEQLV